MKNNKNKKGNMGVLVGMITIILYFIVYLSFFSDFSHSVVSSTDDLACRSYVAVKSVPGIGMAEYFWDLNQKCKVDTNIKINLEDKDESFKQIGDSMAKCWYRYGEGKYDFLSNWDTTGNWCFLCAELEFEDNLEVIKYKDYVDWSRKEKFNDTISYYNYTNIIYTDVDSNEIHKIKDTYEDLTKGDLSAEIKPVLFILGEQIEALNDLNMKTIDASDEEMYVVYRFNRIDKKLTEKMGDAETGMYVGLATGFVTSVLAEALTEAAIIGGISGTATFWGSGFGAIPGAIVGFIKGAVQGVWKTTKSVEKVMKATSHLKKVSSLFKKSRKVSKFSHLKNVDEVLDVLKAGKLDEIRNIASKVDSSNIFKGPLDDIVSAMEKYDLKGMKDLPMALKRNEDLLFDLKKSPIVLKNTDEYLKGIWKTEINDLKKLDLEVNNIIKNVKNGKSLPDDDILKVEDYVRVVVILASGVGGSVGNAILNSNYEQYVDLMTREEYYRLCGTERGNYN